MQQLTKENWLQRNQKYLSHATQSRIVGNITDQDFVTVFIRKYNSALYRYKKPIESGEVTKDGIVNVILNKMRVARYNKEY